MKIGEKCRVTLWPTRLPPCDDPSPSFKSGTWSLNDRGPLGNTFYENVKTPTNKQMQLHLQLLLVYTFFKYNFLGMNEKDSEGLFQLIYIYDHYWQNQAANVLHLSIFY